MKHKTNIPAALFSGFTFFVIGSLASFITLLFISPTVVMRPPKEENNQVVVHNGVRMLQSSWQTKIEEFQENKSVDFSEGEINAMLSETFTIPAPAGSGIKISPINTYLDEEETHIHVKVNLPPETPKWLPTKEIIWSSKGQFAKSGNHWTFVPHAQFLNSARIPSFINFIDKVASSENNSLSSAWQSVKDIKVERAKITFYF